MTADAIAGPRPAAVRTTTYPNAFIVGAPKCATTAMTRYLEAHPRVATMPKEIHRFGSDLDIRRPRMSDEEYARRAAEAGRRADVVIDPSVYYLVSKRAAAEIHAYNPDARILIMLRKPADMMISLHQQVLKSLNEEIADFAEALAAEPDRREGRRIPKSALLTPGLRYREVAAYAEQVARYQALFPPERIKVVLFDDVRADTRAAYEDVCRFLGLDPDPAVDLTPVNEAASVRNRGLVDLQRRVIHRFGLYGVAHRLLPKSVRGPLYRAWLSLLYKPLEKRPVDPALIAALTAEFSEDVTRLERMIGRDLSAWKR